MKKKNDEFNMADLAQKLTLPWLIISIASMISLLAFLIAMFFHFHTAIFFAVFLFIVAAAIVVEGINKRKENHIGGNISFVMAILCVLCAVMVIGMN